MQNDTVGLMIKITAGFPNVANIELELTVPGEPVSFISDIGCFRKNCPSTKNLGKCNCGKYSKADAGQLPASAHRSERTEIHPFCKRIKQKCQFF